MILLIDLLGNNIYLVSTKMGLYMHDIVSMMVSRISTLGMMYEPDSTLMFVLQ